MGTTPTLALPYPEASDPPDVPTDIHELATALDGLVIPDTIADAKGDLLAATGADTMARVAVGADGNVLTADSSQAAGVKWASPGGELAYAQITAAVSVPVSAEAAAVTVITAPAVTVDGATAILVEFFAQQMNMPAGTVGASVLLNLWDSATNLGFIGQFQNPAAAQMIMSTRLARRFTPASGSHTFIVKAWATGATCTIGAGAGGAAGAVAPAFVRITRA